MKTPDRNDHREGSLIIALIMALVAASFLGAAVLSMATSARYQRVHAASINRAYYLAESGGAYARALRKIDKDADPSGTYVMGNGDQFILQRLSHSATTLVFRSTGVANPATRIESRRQLTFDFSEAENDVLPIGFDYDNDGQFDDDMWTTVNVDPTIRDTGPSGGQPALDLKGEQGQIYLNWQAQPPEMNVNLATLWAYSGGLLPYDVQVKIKPFDTGQQAAYSKHYILGISFRVRTNANINSYHCYGLSYFRSLAGTNPGQTPSWVPAMPAAFQGLRGTNVYLITWYRNGDVGTTQLINHKVLTPADHVIEVRNGTPELRDYSTLLLELKERFDANGERENVIRAFIQGVDMYPLWQTSEDMQWQEDPAFANGPVTWEDGAITITDSRLTSASFDAYMHPEIGIHVLYDRFGANLKFFDDFAIRMEGYAEATSTQVQY